MSDKAPLTIAGEPLGEVFKGLVDDIAKTDVPADVMPTIDLKMTFNLSTSTKKGLKFVFTNTKTKGSSLTVDIATRVHRVELKPEES